MKFLVITTGDYENIFYAFFIVTPVMQFNSLLQDTHTFIAYSFLDLRNRDKFRSRVD